MEKLVVEPTLNSPRIVLDPVNNQFEFSGESRPENVRDFYMPVLQWLEDFIAEESNGNDQPDREVHFDFEYFNSTSAKYILDVFKAFYRLHSGGSGIVVKWHYDEDDEDMLEVGQEMSRMSKLPFEYIQTESEE